MRMSDWSSDVCSSDLCRLFSIAGIISKAVPSHELGVEPFGLADPGEVRSLAMLEHEIGVVDRCPADAKHQPVRNCPKNDIGRGIAIFLALQDRGMDFPVLRINEMGDGLPHRACERPYRWTPRFHP